MCECVRVCARARVVLDRRTRAALDARSARRTLPLIARRLCLCVTVLNDHTRRARRTLGAPPRRIAQLAEIHAKDHREYVTRQLGFFDDLKAYQEAQQMDETQARDSTTRDDMSRKD